MNSEADIPPLSGRSRPLWAAACAAAALLLPVIAPGLRALPWQAEAYPDPGTQWVLTLEHRLHAVAARSRSPKVICIGGSSVLFGIDGAALGRRLGVPVIVYGLHAAIGLDLIAASAVDLIRAGDLVLLASEDDHFFKTRNQRDATRQRWLEYHQPRLPPGWRRDLDRIWSLDVARFRCLALRSDFETFCRQTVQKGMRRLRGQHAQPERELPLNPYMVAAIDADGSIRTKCRDLLERPAGRFALDPYPAWKYDFTNSLAADAARLLAEACRQRGATLYLLPTIRLAAPSNTAAFAEVEARWFQAATNSLPDVKCLLAPGAATLPPANAFDTVYHLNNQGVAKLEDRLVPALRHALEAAAARREKMSVPVRNNSTL